MHPHSPLGVCIAAAVFYSIACGSSVWTTNSELEFGPFTYCGDEYGYTQCESFDTDTRKQFCTIYESDNYNLCVSNLNALRGLIVLSCLLAWFGSIAQLNLGYSYRRAIWFGGTTPTVYSQYSTMAFMALGALFGLISWAIGISTFLVNLNTSITSNDTFSLAGGFVVAIIGFVLCCIAGLMQWQLIRRPIQVFQPVTQNIPAPVIYQQQNIGPVGMAGTVAIAQPMPNQVQFQCPSCQTVLSIQAGIPQVRCPRCNNVLQVPGASAPPPQAVYAQPMGTNQPQYMQHQQQPPPGYTNASPEGQPTIAAYPQVQPQSPQQQQVYNANPQPVIYGGAANTTQ